MQGVWQMAESGLAASCGDDDDDDDGGWDLSCFDSLPCLRKSRRLLCFSVAGSRTRRRSRCCFGASMWIDQLSHKCLPACSASPPSSPIYRISPHFPPAGGWESQMSQLRRISHHPWWWSHGRLRPLDHAWSTTRVYQSHLRNEDVAKSISSFRQNLRRSDGCKVGGGGIIKIVRLCDRWSRWWISEIMVFLAY